MSAGATPAGEANTVAVRAMGELGIDMSREFPKPVTDEVVQAADLVITMGCGNACPVYPAKRYRDWEVLGRPQDEAEMRDIGSDSSC
jgi:protein-tyrosine-phosphatase